MAGGSGAARQTADIFDLPIDRDTLTKRGTELVVAGQDWGDVLVSCRLQSFDDGAIGVSFRYQDADTCYRFSMDSERSYRRVVKLVGGNAELLWESADGYVVGRAYQLAVLALGDELRVYLDDVAVCVVSDPTLSHGTVALYCWGNNDAQFSGLRVLGADSLYTAWSLDESFGEAIPGRWDFTHMIDDQPSPGWKIIDGALEHAGAGSGLDFAIVNPHAPSDYRVAARVQRAGSGTVGLVARFQDQENHFAFVVGPEDVRLIRRLDGEETELSRTEVSLPNRELILTLTCDGQRLVGHVDGQQLFDLDNTELPTGRVGAVCAGEVSATVRELKLSEPDWRQHYLFGAERPLPAGTPIELRSGSLSGAETPLSAGESALRFVAQAPDPGEVQLGARAQLRLVDPMGQPEHSREFSPAGTFEPEDANVIRNRDGTSCFVVPASGPADLEQYQLRMTFRRDNRALVPDSPVLRQAGDTSDEEATLTIVRPPSD